MRRSTMAMSRPGSSRHAGSDTFTSWNDALRRTRSEEESRDLAPPSGIGRVIDCVVRGIGLKPQFFRAVVLVVKPLAEFCWNHFIASSDQKCDRTMIIF